MPSDGLRTLISFLLFLHLFALSVAVLSRTGTVSGFRSALRTRTGVSHYLNLLGMDLGYDFHLTRNMPDDFDHVVDLVLDAPTGFRGEQEVIEQQQLETIELMPEDVWPGARKRRYLSLGLSVAANASNDEIASEIPKALVTGLLAQHGRTDGKHYFRCRTIRPRNWGDEANTDPHDPRYYFNDYMADVVATGPGQWNLVKVVSEGEATQLQRQSTSDPATQSPPGSGEREGTQP
ncbi:MAG: hypothetical protein DWQ31_13575 [Planctomycetota bacterium]|nr:MAG: hypothetical protein DWQ31_13575 [Planctomycetota bacterium]REJ90298.1 MAG: hypothetical protein DWQ35_16595 [Planctomycetota bacterium]REK17809.1 MAG: hypothetical protein DWQ42_21665 [Planctomycetota bacterium]REK40961.1 MAG: hypothetical protein DWQ46_14845 [Planctomycetota bacterium]